ncbi:MAG: beta-lactamase family protein [Clostridia bacterium]|nr:beta-lactamase family protein [Clostridia bacterium]
MVLSEKNSELLRKKILAYCEKNRIFGYLRVTVKDETAFELSLGADPITGEPYTADRMFSLYSLSKPFCAIGFMKLRDRGLVHPDDHPGKYIPEARGFDSRVTFRHLLHHISGLPDSEQITDFCQKYAPGLPEKTREHIALLTAYPQYFAPGEGAFYANVNFNLPALAIENITGLPYGQYMAEEVFRPLGMSSAVVDRPGLFIPDRVQGYETDENGLPQPVEKSYDWMFGAGDIVATAKDVYCLNLAIKHRLLLSPESWETVLTPAKQNGMGMGCTVSQWHGKLRITHNGGHTGFRTLHIQLPETDHDIILLSNSGYGEARGDISEMIHDAFFGEDAAEDAAPEMDKGYI